MRTVSTMLALVVLIAAPASADFLTNGNFDTGTLAGWTQHSEAFPAVPPLDIMTAGSVFAPAPNAPTSDGYLAGRGHGGNVGGGNAALYQTVNVPIGIPLTLSFDVAGGIGGFASFDGVGWWEARINEGGWANPDAGALLWKREINTPGGGGFNWEHHDVVYTSTTGTITVFLKHGGWDPQWDYQYFGSYWDTVSLTPEPGALMLLLGALPLLHRRR